MKVASSSGAKHVSILFDSGSDRTYITKDIAKKLKLREVDQVEHRYSVFGGNATTASMHPVREIDLIALSGQIHKINAIEVPVICNPIARPEIPQDILNLVPGVQFAECQEGRFKVDMLIGLDNFWTLMRNNILRFPEHNLVAQETVFGFVLSGQVPGNNKQCTSAQQLLVLNDFSEHEIRNLWELDYIGIMPQEPPSENEVMSDFNKTIQFKEGRYWVSQPWKKDGKTLLTDNLAEARERLTKLNRKLDKDSKLKFDYERVFKEWEDLGIIEEVPSKEINWKKNPLFYLPHRPVIRESSVSTKIRPVFDASAKAKSGVSLNDCLHAGPSLLPDLIKILIRFRRWKVALNADIQKAFLQICLQPEDKDVHRFLLFSNGTERIMRFTRVTFGVNCSPFLLNATIKWHLNQYPETWVTDELKSNLYVDDLLSGADSVEDAHKLYNESKEIMYEAAMTLTKWQTRKKSLEKV